MTDLISVIIPTFNRAHRIEKTIASVRSQTFRNWELIIVDDGSTDNTLEVLERLGEGIKVIRQPNSGPSVARNTGAQAATGKYLAFLDSDDEWLPQKLEEQLKLMVPGVILSATNWRGQPDNSGRTAFENLPFAESWVCDHPTEFVSRHGGHNIMLSSWLVDRTAFRASGGFDPAADPAEDNHLIFRLAFKGKFALTKKVLLLRDITVDDVKLSRPDGDLKYQRRATRSMLLASGNARILAFSDSPSVQRQFGRLYSYYLRREMELAALDGRTWDVRRRALEVLLHHATVKETLIAALGFFSPNFIRYRERKKYPQFTRGANKWF